MKEKAAAGTAAGTWTSKPIAHVIINGENQSLPYNREKQTADVQYAFTSENTDFDAALVNCSGTPSVSGTDAGTAVMRLAASQFTNTDPNFSVDFDVADGSLILLTCEDEAPDGSYANRRVIAAKPAVK